MGQASPGQAAIEESLPMSSRMKISIFLFEMTLVGSHIEAAWGLHLILRCVLYEQQVFFIVVVVFLMNSPSAFRIRKLT